MKNAFGPAGYVLAMTGLATAVSGGEKAARSAFHLATALPSAALSQSAQQAAKDAFASSPLRVSRRNPPYFEDSEGRIVFLAGSSDLLSLVGTGPSDPLPLFDYPGYLPFLQRHNLNFIRICTRENVVGTESGFPAHAWARSGPDTTLDGKPRFDLSPANWISPLSNDPAGPWKNDPPAGDGKKALLVDTDHLWGQQASGRPESLALEKFLRRPQPDFSRPFSGSMSNGSIRAAGK